MKAKYLSAICVMFSVVLLSITGCCCNEKSSQKDVADQEKEIVAVAVPKVEEMKKVIRAQVFIKVDKIGDFLDFTKNLVAQSQAEEGNISYTLYQDPSDKTKFIFFEEWKNQEAIDFHFNTEHFKTFDATIGEYSTNPAVVTIYDVNSEK